MSHDSVDRTHTAWFREATPQGRPRQGICHRGSVAGLLAVAFASIGCRGVDEALRSDQYNLVWLLVPLLGFGLMGFSIVLLLRRHQLAAWDLAQAATPPSAGGLVLGTYGIASGLTVLFGGYNLWLDAIVPLQRGLNVGLWLLGSIVGSAIAVHLGLRVAEP